MRFENVSVVSLGYTLPREVVSTAEIETRLTPLYERLRLPEGRLELMSGIRERRFFAPGMRMGVASAGTGRRALEASGVAADRVGALVHASVCRDFLEPATACSVHHALALSTDCVVYDLSNACLGVLNGMLQVANMIELGQIETGLIVGTECGRSLVENTIARLNSDQSLRREDLKPAIASLTIGSASVAVLLGRRDQFPRASTLDVAVAYANTAHHELCQSHGLMQLMSTDSEQLLAAGVATGAQAFARLRAESRSQPCEFDRTICHQVGAAHRKAMLEALALDAQCDFTTFEWLGNTGSAALPVTLANAIERGNVAPGQRVGLLGIGSGINSVMLGCDWGDTAVLGGEVD